MVPPPLSSAKTPPPPAGSTAVVDTGEASQSTPSAAPQSVKVKEQYKQSTYLVVVQTWNEEAPPSPLSRSSEAALRSSEAALTAMRGQGSC